MTATIRTSEIPTSMAAGDLVYRTPPRVRFVRAQGIRLYDSDGRAYLDAEASNGALAWGYEPSIMREAAVRSVDLPALPSFCESELRVRVVSRLAQRFDAAVGVPGRVALELGGAQGIEMAMRIVAANRGGGQILAFQGGYHGRSPFTAHLSASSRYRAVQPWPGPEVVRLPYPDCGTCPHRPAVGCNTACSEVVERLGGNDVLGVPSATAAQGVAALILEPLLNVGGSVLPDSGHLRRIVDHVRSLGGLIVVDEIFTGLHRLGPEWGFQLHGIQPDIIVASKALTNGITALSAVWAREPLAAPDVFPPGSHSSTFAGNPHALAVVETVLDRWDGWPDAQAAVEKKGRHLHAALERVCARRNLVTGVDTVGLLARVELAGPLAMRLRQIAAEPTHGEGLLLASTGMAPATIILHPPLVTSIEDLDTMVELLDRAVEELERQC
jgi:4-aminobutyrate aminotransferase-like enzyme